MKHQLPSLKERSENYTLLTDFYELTMSQTYFNAGLKDHIASFDLYYRRVPEAGGYVIAAGLESVIDYLKNLYFSEEDLNYLRSLNTFSEAFLDYLRNFKFTCDVYSVPEGTPVFPNEPILKVRGPIIEAQIIETMLLLCINHQSLIATKASRVHHAARGKAVLEFGARRAQGTVASILGARAAYIGGIDASSCTLAGRYYQVPLSGTMAHAFVQTFEDEFEAFKTYAETYPENTVLLVDTYNTLQTGVPNAIRVAKEVLEPKGYRLKGIRIDSGDLAYLSQKAREQLDQAGLFDCQIVVSNSLDEYIMSNLFIQGAKIDAFGVGERLITSRAEPVLGGVYKLVAVGKDEQSLEARIKLSDNVEKITNPGDKQLVRFYGKEDGMALADLIMLAGEALPQGEPYEIFHPIHTWKRKELQNYEVKSLLKPIFIKGECVYQSPSLEDIRAYSQKEKMRLWASHRRFENPETYIVDLSQKLWDIKTELLHKARRK